MPDNLGGTASRPTTNLHLVPPRPVATRRPSLLAVLAEVTCSLWRQFSAWIDGHVSYREIERERMDYVLRGWCGDCDDRVTIVTHNGREHCIRCAGTAVDEVGVVWMEREDGGS